MKIQFSAGVVGGGGGKRGGGGFSPAPHWGLIAPGPWPGFPYFELSELSPMDMSLRYTFPVAWSLADT